MVRRGAAVLSAVIVASSACGGLFPGGDGLSIARTDAELRIAVAGWATSGAQVFVCPNPIVIPAERRNVEPMVLAAGCIVAGQVGGEAGAAEVALRFDDLIPFHQSRLDDRPTWSIVVLEFPEPPGRPPKAVQQLIVGGPIRPVPAPP